jgi:hypothetical protein
MFEGHPSTCGAGSCLPVTTLYCCDLGACSNVLSHGDCTTGTVFDTELACTTACPNILPPTSYYCCKNSLCTAIPSDQSSLVFCTDPNVVPTPDSTCGGSCAVATSTSTSTSTSAHYCCVNGACSGQQSTACTTPAATYPDLAQCTAGCMQSSASTSASQPLCCNGQMCVPYSVPSAPCGMQVNGTCGGACPVGDTCTFLAPSAQCSCQPTPPSSLATSLASMSAGISVSTAKICGDTSPACNGLCSTGTCAPTISGGCTCI